MITNIVAAISVMIVTNFYEVSSIDNQMLGIHKIEYSAITPVNSDLHYIHWAVGKPNFRDSGMLYNPWAQDSITVPTWKKRFKVVCEITDIILTLDGKQWVLRTTKHLKTMEQKATRTEIWSWEIVD